jgi:hypothetical protein
MQIQYQCNVADYQEALLTRRPTPLGRKVFRAGMWLLLIIMSSAILMNLGFRQGIATLTVPILLFLSWLAFRLVIRPIWIKRDFHSHPNFQREQLVRIDESGLHRTSEIGQSETKWLAYTGYQETQNLFVLYFGRRLMEVIPKRALSAEQLQRFRQLLLEHLRADANASYPGQSQLPSPLS